MEQNAFEISASDSKHKHRKNISITTNKQTNKAHATKLTFDVQNVIFTNNFIATRKIFTVKGKHYKSYQDQKFVYSIGA